MAELKTGPTHESVHSFINSFDNPKKRKDCHEILSALKQITGAQPELWRSGIIGFGRYRFKHKPRQNGEWFLTGFAPKKGNITFYIMNGIGKYEEILPSLGIHKAAKACLYIPTLDEVDTKVLYGIIESSVQDLKKKYLKAKT